MTSKENHNLDPRWEQYQKRFYSLPVFYFASLEYPESIEEAKQILSRLEIEINNIDSQFSQRKDRLLYEGQGTDDAMQKDYLDWKIKAQKAQQMRHNQVAVIQSWIYDKTVTKSKDDDRVAALEKKVVILEETIKKLLTASCQSA